ncbi:MAG: IS66 family transposase [Myxococcota bacterium]
MAFPELPDDPEALREFALRQRALLDEKQSLVEAQSEELRLLREYIRWLPHHRFGRSSEQSSDEQIRLFNEAESATEDPGDEEEAAIVVGAHARKKPGRKPLPEWIPRIEILHDLPEDEKVCAHDGTALERIDEEISEQLEFIPAQFRVLRHVRPQYACPTCRTGIQTAPVPPQPIPKSLASPTLLAHVATSKYVDGLPLYRQETMFRRLGIGLPRASLAHWMVKIGELVQPLINLLREDLLSSGFVQCDESRYQVLKEPGKVATSQSYIWVQRSMEPAVVLYDYDPSRSAEVPKRLLAGYQGFLQTDGYGGYDALGQEPGIVHVGCWAHARRKFDEALKAQKSSPKKKRSLKESKALQGLGFIQKLYKIERQIRGKPPDEINRIRQEHSAPLLEKLRAWLSESIPRVPPQSLTGKALGYLDGQWPKLIRVLDDGRLPLDTNRVENAIRPFVVGRKSWLFAAPVRGAQASANLYSLIETAKANGLEPFAYLRTVLTELPRATTLDQVEALLPRLLDPGRLQDASHFRSLR